MPATPPETFPPSHPGTLLLNFKDIFSTRWRWSPAGSGPVGVSPGPSWAPGWLRAPPASPSPPCGPLAPGLPLSVGIQGECPLLFSAGRFVSNTATVSVMNFLLSTPNPLSPADPFFESQIYWRKSSLGSWNRMPRRNRMRYTPEQPPITFL